MKVPRATGLAVARDVLDALAEPGDGPLQRRLSVHAFRTVVCGSLRRGAGEVRDGETLGAAARRWWG